MDDDHAEIRIREARVVIEGWMRMVLDTNGIERFDDLHIDQINPTWRDRGSWLEGSSPALQLAIGVESNIATEKTLAITFSLSSEDDGIPTPISSADLSEQMDGWTPPSLYLFEPRKEPWADPGTVAMTPPIAVFPACSECFVMQFRTKDGNELRRTFVAVS